MRIESSGSKFNLEPTVFLCFNFPVFMLKYNHLITKQKIMSKHPIGRKTAVFVLIALLFSLLPISRPALADATLTSVDKSIVKIYNYDLGEDNWLEAKGSGSGVILSPDGLVLTNAHVVAGDDSIKISDPYFAICVTEQINMAPVCRYTARLIAQDENMDIAILKMRSLDGAGVSGLNYLELASSAAVNGAALTLYGFPDIGGETLTTTTGTVVGQEQSGGVNWLKTDAVISFGSSGGAAVNADNKIAGLVSQASSSSLNSLSYIIDINSVSSWISQNRNNSGRPSILESRLNTLLSRTLSAKASHVFFLSYPKISLTCPSDFITVITESSIACLNIADDNFFGFGVYIVKEAYEKTFDDLKNLSLESLVSSLGSFSNITQEESTFAGRPAMKYTVTDFGENRTLYSFPFRQFTVSVISFYGTGDINKEAIDSGLKTFTFDPNYTEPFTEQTSYSQTDPLLIFSPTANWVFLEKNSLDEPADIVLKHQPNAIVTLSTEPTLPGDDNLDNQKYYEQNNALSDFDSYFSEALTGLKQETLDLNYNYTLNSTIQDAIKIDRKMINSSTGLAKMYRRDIFIRREGYVIELSFTYNGSDEVGFNNLKTASDQLLSHLTVSSEGVPPVATSENKNTPPVVASEPVIIENPERYTAEELEFLQMYGLTKLPWEKDMPEVVEPTPPATSQNNIISPLPATEHDEALASRLSGRLLLSVEDHGKIYYVNPSDHRRYQVTFGNALALFRHFAMGITTSDLNKIPINQNSVSANVDTDSDGFNDKSEVANGYNPEIASNPSARGNDKMKFDQSLAQRFKGRFLLQVEDRGRIWYVDQAGTRWEVTWSNLMMLFQSLALGINNDDLGRIDDRTTELGTF